MTQPTMKNSFGALTELKTAQGNFRYYRLETLEKQGLGSIGRLPISIQILLETLLRIETGLEVTADDIIKLASYNPSSPGDFDVPFMPGRVLLQDFTGVPCVVDLAAMRSAMARLNGNPQRINPLIPVDLVIDHSIQVDYFNSVDAYELNAKLEFERNRERYEFLRWGQKAFDNFRVIPPASGICHQVNLEYLATVVQRRTVNGVQTLFPDTCIGTDSHTPMVNGLGVVGWGVGGIEAEAVMLGQPMTMVVPEVIGVKLTGRLPDGATATDLVLTLTQLLRKLNVVNKFIEYFGDGLTNMSVADRATIANMSPENGSTIGFFPVDDRTLEYLRQTGRSEEQVGLVEVYNKAQGWFRTDDFTAPEYKQVVELDLSTVQPSVAGPRRPQDRVSLNQLKLNWRSVLAAPVEQGGFAVPVNSNGGVPAEFPKGNRVTVNHGDVVIAAITSCTNTSNPSVMLAAGLLAKKAYKAGLRVKPHVKTSLAPGSRVVTDYLERAGLTEYLNKMGFSLVGYGCTTCIGNSGPVPEPIAEAIDSGKLVVASVLSGNRNFSGRINPHTKAAYLASPPLVVAFAIAGTIDIDLTSEPLGKGANGLDIYLRDIWPSPDEINEMLKFAHDPQLFRRRYTGIESSNEAWNALAVGDNPIYEWSETSTYIQEPPFLFDLSSEPGPISPLIGARVLVMAGDSVTTDHISPAGSIAKDSPAAKYLMEQGVQPSDFNSYGSRRGNDRVMTRGTFANIMFRNQLGQGRLGGWTTHFPSGDLMTVYDASRRYRDEAVPLIVIAGKDYGMGSSRDWAAKGTFLLGVRAVIAESFERIHRSNLIGMGVLPLQFLDGENAEFLGLTGRETYSIRLGGALSSRETVEIEFHDLDGRNGSFKAIVRLDSPVEIDYYRNGGILPAMLRRFMQ